MTAVKVLPEVPVVALVEVVWRRLRVELAAVGTTVAPDLRSSHLRVLALTPTEGVRVTDLAALTTMTAQSLGELLQVLRDKGYLDITTLPADRRVRQVRPTERGRQVAQTMRAELAALDERWRDEVGPRRWSQLRATLAALGSPEMSGAELGRRPARRRAQK